MWPAGLTLAITLTWIFKVKYRICYISAKNGPIPTKRKANTSIELWGSNVTRGFDLGHDLDLEFSRSNIEFAISQPKMVRLPRNEKQTYWLNSRPQMWPMVWIYQIVTGVTSVVGVPSTHLVLVNGGWAIRQQAITWANVDPDLCRHMVSLGHNELVFPSI